MAACHPPDSEHSLVRDSKVVCEGPGHVLRVEGCLGAGVAVGSLVPLCVEIHASLAILDLINSFEK